MRSVIVAVGRLPIDAKLRSLTQEFGWSLLRIPTVRQIRRVANAFNVIAILFEPQAVAGSWQQALKIIQESAPQALPVVCHRFSEPLPWPELAEAGAFVDVWLPFDVREVRQSLGFVQSAQLKRLAEATFDSEKPHLPLRSGVSRAQFADYAA